MQQTSRTQDVKGKGRAASYTIKRAIGSYAFTASVHMWFEHQHSCDNVSTNTLYKICCINLSDVCPMHICVVEIRIDCVHTVPSALLRQ
jgi:hypothetical protein